MTTIPNPNTLPPATRRSISLQVTIFEGPTYYWGEKYDAQFFIWSPSQSHLMVGWGNVGTEGLEPWAPYEFGEDYADAHDEELCVIPAGGRRIVVQVSCSPFGEWRTTDAMAAAAEVLLAGRKRDARARAMGIGMSSR